MEAGEVVRQKRIFPFKLEQRSVKFKLNAFFDLALKVVVLSILVINIWHSDVKNVIRSRPRGR